jgi:hypothetical protein
MPFQYINDVAGSLLRDGAMGKWANGQMGKWANGQRKRSCLRHRLVPAACLIADDTSQSVIARHEAIFGVPYSDAAPWLRPPDDNVSFRERISRLMREIASPRLSAEVF